MLSTTGYTQYDYHTGAIVNLEDINGLITKASYADPLDRQTQVVYAVGSEFERQETVAYCDSERRTTTTGDRFVLNDNAAHGETLYDEFGRVIESRRYDSDGYVAVRTEYDALGRKNRVTNPFRPTINETPLWTESTFDSLGRVLEIETPDGAKVLTSFFGNTETTTDQAGNKRRSVSNGIGQLIRLDEPNAGGELGEIGAPYQPTNYSYDALDNLISVQQIGTSEVQCGGVLTYCEQNRSFNYSGLSRLLSAQNPESGTIQYAYDPNGNLTTKTDARGVVTAYVYDALNRVTARNYSNEPSGQNPTPNVAYTYDAPAVAFSKGKLTKVDNGFSKTEFTQFDNMGRVIKSRQTTDGTVYNEMEYTYNLSGALIEEKYPSGRVVKNTPDNDGDLMQIQSAKANQTLRNYANGFTYTAAGAVSAMRLGNGKWESTQFNSRLQPTRIGLGGSASDQSLLKLDYTYGVVENNQLNTAKNNGNIQSQTITVPAVGSSIGFTAVQTYNYDALNRIDDATEMVTPAGSSTATQSWKQDFSFDRYGNRNLVEENSTTLPKNCINSTVVCDSDKKIFNPSISTSTNRIDLDQDGDNVNDYAVDLSGNTTKYADGTTFVFDAENKQIEVKNPSNGTIGKYWYDGDGRRVKKLGWINGRWEETIFVFDASSRLVAEYSTILNPTPQVAYLTNDHLGSPRINTNENGAVVSRHDYRPYGEEVAERMHTQYAGDTIRKQFTGYERDVETELDYAKARYHNYNHGRFTIPDDFLKDTKTIEPASWNLYVYVRNNPVKYVDSSGESVDGSGLSDDERTRLIAEFARITGYRVEDLYFNSNGLLVVADGARSTGGSATARRLLNEAINSSWEFVLVGVNTTDVAFANHAPVPGSPRYNENGQRVSHLVGQVRVDFADFNNAVFENDTARQSFSLGIVILHEFVHGLYDKLDDHKGGGAGEIENNWINPIREELGLPTRDSYFANFISQEEASTYSLQTQQGVRLSFTKYETIPPIDSSLTSQPENTYPATTHVYWQINTVGGKIR